MANLIHYAYGGAFALIIVVSLAEESRQCLAVVLVLLALLVSGILTGKGKR